VRPGAGGASGPRKLELWLAGTTPGKGVVRDGVPVTEEGGPRGGRTCLLLLISLMNSGGETSADSHPRIHRRKLL
jgi:hypothetical protein